MENTRVHLTLPAHHVFGGFWIRFAAVMIDQVIIALSIIAAWVVLFIPLAGLSIVSDAAEVRADAVYEVVSIVFLVAAIAWAYGYYILFLGKKSTTPGKMLFGMRVVREDNGGAVTWGQATGRTFATLLSRIFYVGYIIAAFDEEKRSLHDLLAKTRVIRDTRKSTTAGWVLFSVIFGVGMLAAITFISLVPVVIERLDSDFPEFSNEQFDPTEYDMEQLRDIIDN